MSKLKMVALAAVLGAGLGAAGCAKSTREGPSAPPPAAGDTAGKVKYECSKGCGVAPVHVAEGDPTPQCCGAPMTKVH